MFSLYRAVLLSLLVCAFAKKECGRWHQDTCCEGDNPCAVDLSCDDVLNICMVDAHSCHAFHPVGDDDFTKLHEEGDEPIECKDGQIPYKVPKFGGSHCCGLFNEHGKCYSQVCGDDMNEAAPAPAPESTSFKGDATSAFKVTQESPLEMCVQPESILCNENCECSNEQISNWILVTHELAQSYWYETDDSKMEGCGALEWTENNVYGTNKIADEARLAFSFHIPSGQEGLYKIAVTGSRHLRGREAIGCSDETKAADKKACADEHGVECACNDEENDIWVCTNGVNDPLQNLLCYDFTKEGGKCMKFLVNVPWDQWGERDNVNEKHANFEAVFRFEAGDHTLTIAGRSMGTAVDKICMKQTEDFGVYQQPDPEYLADCNGGGNNDDHNDYQNDDQNDYNNDNNNDYNNDNNNDDNDDDNDDDNNDEDDHQNDDGSWTDWFGK